ncbi:hypothetical protein BDF19DRAFT_449985 [Syncephalis fuscata]|nr:hypothetical protein BDF19DRAFT_449985 [Syncephalis fuscata]
MFGKYTRLCALAVACLIASTSHVDAQQCQVRQRQEIRTLSAQQRTAFLGAIRSMQSTGSPSKYDEYTLRHNDAHDAAHGKPMFLPWHRWFIREFEKDLQRFDPSIMLPYWDWSYDSQRPAASPIFRSDWLGGNGNPNNNYCVDSGTFAQHRPSYPSPHCLRRRFNRGTQLSPYTPPEELLRIKQAATYGEFKNQLEGPPHGNVHMTIDTTGTDMSTMYSPNDPIFWVHHAFVDKIWADWQAINSRNMRAYGADNERTIGVTSKDQLFNSPLRVEDVFDTRALCYTYAPFRSNSLLRRGLPSESTPTGDNSTSINAKTTSAPASDNSTSTNTSTTTTPPTLDTASKQYTETVEILALQHPMPLPDHWIIMNKLNVTETRQNEAKQYELIESCNKNPKYISPVVPFRNENVMKDILSYADNIICTLGGKQLKLEVNKTISDIGQYIVEIIKKVSKFIAKVQADGFEETANKIFNQFKKPVSH